MATRKARAATPDAAPPTEAPQAEEPKVYEPILSVEAYVAPEVPVTVKDLSGHLHVFQMRLLKDMTAVQRQRLSNIWGRVIDVLGRTERDEEITREEEAYVEDGYDRIVRACLPEMPDDLRGQLASVTKENISNHFFAVAAMMDLAATARASGSPTTGASSSPNSSASTKPKGPTSGSTRTRRSSTPA